LIVDTIIKNGRLVLPNSIIEGGIGIEKGQIVIIAKDVNLPHADEVIDAQGKFILPGSIDAHVHFRYPFSSRPYEKEENWWTGSQAAACGGITTVLAMPLNAPIESIVREAKNKSIIDFGLYGGLSRNLNIQDNIKKIYNLSKEGVIGYKIFLTYQNPPDDSSLFQYYEAIRDTNLPVSMHAENQNIIRP